MLGAWIADSKSFLTKDVWIQIDYFLSQYRLNAVSAGLRMEGMENIYNHLTELLTPLNSGESVQQQQESIVKMIQENVSVYFFDHFIYLNTYLNTYLL